MTAFNRSAARPIGWLLCRVIVPLWVLTGAVFKLVESSPKLLPKETILKVVDGLGIDLYLGLATLIALEFLAVAVMFFLARFARAMAIFMLSVFCLVLLGEMVRGNFADCGCLGANSPPPWLMLGIDGGLLLAVLLLKPRVAGPAEIKKWVIPATAVFMIAGTAASYGIVIPAGRAPVEVVQINDEPGETQSDRVSKPAAGGVRPSSQPTVQPDGTIDNPTPAPLPSYFFVSDIESWVGKPWREVELVQLMRNWPSDLDSAKRHIIFYSRTCDHCEEMFRKDLVGELAAPVTAVEIPASKTQLRGDNPWSMPQTQCQLLTLPIGTDWILTAPLIITIENGVVTCAEEGNHRRCMGLE